MYARGMNVIKLFKESICFYRIGLAISMLAGGSYLMYLWNRYGFSPILLLALPAFMLCAFLAWFGALIAATAAHQRFLDILYNRLEPQAFITAYHLYAMAHKGGQLHRITMLAHLANGYANDGRYDEAIRLLADVSVPAGRQHDNLLALVQGNQMEYHLMKRDVESARELFDAQEDLVNSAKGRISPAFAHNLALAREHLNYLLGQPVQDLCLRNELTVSSNMLHKLNIRLLLARAWLKEGRNEDALNYLKAVLRDGKNTDAAQKAKAILAEQGADRQEKHPEREHA